jgi:hypothetical protein
MSPRELFELLTKARAPLRQSVAALFAGLSETKKK